MNAIFRKTLRRCYGTAFGYVTAAVLMLILGVCMVLYHANPAAGSADISLTLQTLLLALVVVIPAVCAYTVTVENKRGETKFLFSLPISAVEIVLGRFFAALSVICIPLSMLLLFPFVFTFYGTPALGTAFLSLVGFVLLLGAMVALSLTVATLTGSVALSFLGGFGALALLYFVSPLVGMLPSGISTPLLQFLSSFDIFLCFDSFTYGRIDFAGVLNLLLFTLLCLFLSAFILQRQKTKGARGAQKSTLWQKMLTKKSAAVKTVPVVLLCAVLLAVLPDGISSVDASGVDTYRTGEQTATLLSSLKQDVTLYYAVEGGRQNADMRFLGFLRSYEQKSKHITVKVVDSTDKEFLSDHGGIALESGSVVVESDRRYRVVGHSDMTFLFNSYLGLQMTNAEYYTYISALVQGSGSDSQMYEIGSLLYQYADYTDTYFIGEESIGSAILFTTLPTVPVMYIASDADASLPGTAMQMELYEKLYDMRLHSLADGDVPSDCDLLLLHAPQKDLTAEQAERLRSYLNGGGKLMLTTMCDISYPVLGGVLAEYGLSFYDEGNLVCEGDGAYMFTDENSKQYPYYIQSHIAPLEGTAGVAENLLVLYAHGIQLTEVEGVQVTPWLYTSDKGYLVQKSGSASGSDEGSISEKGRYVFGALAQKGESAVVWIGAGYALTDAVNTNAEGGNYRYACALADWMTDSSNTPLFIEGKLMQSTVLYPAATDALIWGILMAVLAPLAVLIIGFSVRTIRRKR